MNKATITKAQQGGFLIDAEGYDSETIPDRVQATEIYLLRANGYIGTMVRHLNNVHMYDRDWVEIIIRAGMIAEKGMVVKPFAAELKEGIVAHVFEYTGPAWDTITYTVNENSGLNPFRATCTCPDFKITMQGIGQDTKEMVSLPISRTGKQVYCKHIVAYLLIANAPGDLAETNPLKEEAAIHVMKALRTRYALDYGAQNIPEWLKKMRPVEIADRKWFVCEVEEQYVDSDEQNRDATETTEELLEKLYPKLHLELSLEAI